jgi:dienelactone hydrolase
VIVLLHGKHVTCRIGDFALPYDAGAACPESTSVQIPSYHGFGGLARNLASHGYLVVAPDANDINERDGSGDYGTHARDQLIARTIDLLESWSHTTAPGAVGDTLRGRVDLTRIGIMGHSRGGEAAAAFPQYNRGRLDGPVRPGLRAVLNLAGTDYNVQTPYGVDYAAIVPTCDGDVSDFQAAWTYDRGRYVAGKLQHVRVQWVIRGANHNYFNDEWDEDNPPVPADDYEASEGDDGNDSACRRDSQTSVRLTPEDQRRIGYGLIAAFLRYSVGDELQFAPLLRGAVRTPPALCPTAPGRSCVGLLGTSYLAGAHDRRTLIRPEEGAASVRRTVRGGKLLARGFAAFSACTPKPDKPDGTFIRDPGTNSGCPTNPSRSRARQLTLTWDRSARLRIRLARAERNVAPFSALTFRAAVNFSDARNEHAPHLIRVELTDSRGRHAWRSVGGANQPALTPPPGTTFRQVVLNGVRVPLARFRGVDRRRIRSITLHFGRTARGSIQLAELALQDRRAR